MHSHRLCMQPPAQPPTDPPIFLSFFLSSFQVQAQIARSLAVKRELQQLEEQALEDRVRIQRLLALPQPLRGGDVTIVLPSTTTGSGSSTAAAASPSTSRRGSQEQGQRQDVGGEGEEGDGGEAGPVSVVTKRGAGAWAAKALKTERDPVVARKLREIQAHAQVSRSVD